MNKKIKKIKKKIKRWLKYTNKIRFVDYSEYESEYSNDGGAYSYSTTYEFIPHLKKFEVSYGCSSSFDFCPVCGFFDDHRMRDEEGFLIPDGGYECGEFQLLNADKFAVEVMKHMRHHEYLELP